MYELNSTQIDSVNGGGCCLLIGAAVVGAAALGLGAAVVAAKAAYAYKPRTPAPVSPPTSGGAKC